MTLTSGARLGPYEIVAAIGAGGMGEVFRARDTKLDRDVAIKVLPAEFAQDRERLVVKNPASIARYLAAAGEPTEAPGRSPPRAPPYWNSPRMAYAHYQAARSCFFSVG
jgi:serine/threonine protein kinase